MTGELFEINGDELKVVSLDGHRISIRKIQLKNAYTPKKVVIPGKTLNEISKILSGETDKDVSIFFTDNHVVFEFDSTTVVSRLIEGEYFRIDQMLSSDYETKVTINKKEFLSCIDRATLLVKEGEKKPIIINITDGYGIKDKFRYRQHERADRHRKSGQGPDDRFQSPVFDRRPSRHRRRTGYDISCESESALFHPQR